MTCIIATDCSPEPPLLVSKGFAVVALTFSRSGDTASVTGTSFVRLEGAQVTGAGGEGSDERLGLGGVGSMV